MIPKNPPPLYGLVLAGGRSRRMGRDKKDIAYHGGERHAQYTARLLGGVCARVFVSCRADQEADPGLEGLAKIPDAFSLGGPLNGILSAQAAHPGAAFLVAACDLPFLSAEALELLAAERDPARAATVFENPERDALEPLCAIYEPGFARLAEPLLPEGLTCPTRILERLAVRRIRPETALFLRNANRPEECAEALAALRDLS